jgi:dTDP-4-amino-4,6-dideoxy-D-galactose acyltransferase
MLIKPVRWDSVFFGLKIGRITSTNFDRDLFEKEKNKFDLIYIQHISPILLQDHPPVEGVQFEDRKITYSKTVEDIPLLPAGISLFTGKAPNKQLVELALQSGEFSRFRLDLNFKKKSYEHLYTKWIQNSANKKLAFCILIYGDISNPDGFITLQRKGDTAHVGLFAVSKQARNKGIGKKLMLAAEHIAHKYHFKQLNVITQSDNKLACRLYERCGFMADSVIFTYHYWNKK